MTNQLNSNFSNIIFDLDSTLVTVEGIDELARYKGVEALIEPMTQRAMNGELSVEAAFIERLEIINPTLAQVSSLTQFYQDNLTLGVQKLITQLHDQGKHVFIVSGGYDPAVTEFAAFLNIPADHVFANRLEFNTAGEYLGLKQSDVLWKPDGKKHIVAEIQKKYPGRTVVIGDGVSDLEAAETADKFICFAGVARRESVIAQTETVMYEADISSLVQYL